MGCCVTINTYLSNTVRIPYDGLAPVYKGKLEKGHKGTPNGLKKYNPVLKMWHFGQPVMYVCVFKMRVN
jgi:hypothetical protein